MSMLGCAAVFASNEVHAYVGPSFLRIPGIEGDARNAAFHGWIRAESNYWNRRPVLREIRGAATQKNDLLFTGSQAPAAGPEMLAVSIAKTSPAFAVLVERCQSGASLPELTFAESSDLARHPQEHGPRPADVPAYYEYRLTNVRLTCPVADGAPEQGFGLVFERIEWLNFRREDAPRPVTAKAAPLPPALSSGARRVFAISWFAAAVDATPEQCARMNRRPEQAQYYALLSPEAAAAERARFAAAGFVDPDNMALRGPGQMHVTLMPGIVPDPGHEAPRATEPPGLDLDGRPGNDNRLFVVEGCVEGHRRRGFLPMIFNESRTGGGRPTALVEISGIDDFTDDPEIVVNILYSTDAVLRSPGKVPLADYTYRVTDSGEYTQDFASFRGRIVAGVILTGPIARLHMHEAVGIETTLVEPRLRLRLEADGTLKGIVGGYIDWRKRYVWETFRANQYENSSGFQAPGIYNAIRRAADGLPNRETGELEGISAAFEIEGIPAFLAVRKK
jgi:type VI protein secretion system component Hcp